VRLLRPVLAMALRVFGHGRIRLALLKLGYSLEIL
jgi:hypothetical protein